MKNEEDQQTSIITDIDKFIHFLISANTIEGPIQWCDCKGIEIKVIHAADAILDIVLGALINAFQTLEIRKRFLIELINNTELKNHCNIDAVIGVLEINIENSNLH